MSERKYSVISTTANAAATKTHVTAAAPANGRVKVRGFICGNSAATAAQGVEWELLRLSVDATGGAVTPAPLDPDLSAARFTALSTITVEGTASTKLVQLGHDILAPLIHWFPRGDEPEIVNSGIVALRKIVGADTSAWGITLFFAE